MNITLTLRSTARSLILCFLGLAATVFPGIGSAQEPGDPAAAAYRGAYKKILDEDWPTAIDAFGDILTRYPASSWTDDAHFWRCFAHQQSGQAAAETFRCFEELTHQRPDSEWVDDAKRHLVSLAQRLAKEGQPEYRERVRSFGQNEDHEELLAVLVALGDIGDERSLDVVFDRLDNTEDEHLRSQIVEVLSDFDSPRATEKLVQVITADPSVEVRQRAIQSLEEIPGKTFTLLREIAMDKGQPITLRRSAVERLAESEGPDLVPFFAALARDSSSPELAEGAIFSLGEISSDQAFRELTTLFSKADSRRIRLAVLAAIAERKDPRAMEFLRQTALDSSDSELALEAVALLGEIETPEALAHLLQFANTATDWRLRAVAIHAIGELETEAAVEALAAIGKKAGEDPRLRQAVAEALAETELDSAVPPLLTLARSDPDPQVRRAAAEALGEHGSAAARDALIQLLESKKGN